MTCSNVEIFGALMGLGVCSEKTAQLSKLVPRGTPALLKALQARSILPSLKRFVKQPLKAGLKSGVSGLGKRLATA